MMMLRQNEEEEEEDTGGGSRLVQEKQKKKFTKNSPSDAEKNWCLHRLTLQKALCYAVMFRKQ